MKDREFKMFYEAKQNLLRIRRGKMMVSTKAIYLIYARKLSLFFFKNEEKERYLNEQLSVHKTECKNVLKEEIYDQKMKWKKIRKTYVNKQKKSIL